MKKGLLVLLGAMLLVPTLIFAEGEKKVDFYGMAQYRLRYRMLSTTYDSTDLNTSANDYMDRIAYCFGAKAKVNEQVFMQMELGNWYIGTQAVGIGDQLSGIDYMTMFHLAYATWNQGAFDVTIGLQPVKGTRVLDLLNQSIRNDNYAMAVDYAWAVYQTNRLGGIKLGIPLLKGDNSLAFNLLSAPLGERGAAEGTDDTRISSPTKQLLYVTLPFKQGPLSITPDVAVIMNRNYFDDNEYVDNGSDMELAYGLTASYKLSDAVSFNAGFGMASQSNENSTADTVMDVQADTATTGAPMYKQSGMNLSVGTAIKAGPGTAKLTVYFNTDENTEVDGSKNSYTYVDANYSYAANSNFTIMPRVRLFLTSFNEKNNTKDGKMEIRPELIFIGKF